MQHATTLALETVKKKKNMLADEIFLDPIRKAIKDPSEPSWHRTAKLQSFYPDFREDPKSRSLNGGSYNAPLVV